MRIFDESKHEVMLSSERRTVRSRKILFVRKIVEKEIRTRV